MNRRLLVMYMGSVSIHHRFVCDGLYGLSAWQDLKSPWRQISGNVCKGLSDYVNQDGKTHHKCGQHHSLRQSLGLHKIEKASWAPAFISLCSLTAGAMWSAASPITTDCSLVLWTWINSFPLQLFLPGYFITATGKLIQVTVRLGDGGTRL